MEPRKKTCSGCRRCVCVAEGSTSACAIASVRATWRGRRTWHARKLFARQPGALQLDRRWRDIFDRVAQCAGRTLPDGFNNFLRARTVRVDPRLLPKPEHRCKAVCAEPSV